MEQYFVTHTWKILENSSLYGKTHTISSHAKVVVTKITPGIPIISAPWSNRELKAKRPTMKRLFPWSYKSLCSIALNKNYAFMPFSFSKCIYRETNKGKWFCWYLFYRYAWSLLVLEQATCGQGTVSIHAILELLGACRLWFIWPYLDPEGCWRYATQQAI